MGSSDIPEMVELTELGKQKALEIKGRGPRYDTLTALYENGRMTLEDLEGELELAPDKVSLVVRSLEKKGYVRRLS